MLKELIGVCVHVCVCVLAADTFKRLVGEIIEVREVKAGLV